LRATYPPLLSGGLADSLLHFRKNGQAARRLARHDTGDAANRKEPATRLTSLYSVIGTTDVAASRRFYELHLGFHAVFDATWYVHLVRDTKAGAMVQLAVMDAHALTGASGSRPHPLPPPAGRARSLAFRRRGCGDRGARRLMKTVCKYVRPRRSGRLMTSCGEDSEAGRSS
jgi:catechol 2,3-dioxygenase-like lactoylglutathione lyase family enzyme